MAEVGSRHDPRHAGNLRRDLPRAKAADFGDAPAIAYFRVVVPDMPAEDGSQLAVERIATELARLVSANDDAQRQEWVDYLSGKGRVDSRKRPVTPPQS